MSVSPAENPVSPTRHTSPLLQVRWVSPGPESAPTALAFTGFGHRLDPWQRLRPADWRVGVVEFPVGSPAGFNWEAAELARQLGRFWRSARRRALLSFSYGGLGATAVGRVLAQADPHNFPRPDFAAYVAPVQWARAPWTLLKTVPRGARPRVLKGLANGGARVGALARGLGGESIGQFVQLVARYVGWDFVNQYLPYIDWIDSEARTVATWDGLPWPNLLVGARRDRVIPATGMHRLAAKHPNVDYVEVDASHFNAVDAARPELLRRLGALLV